MVALNFSSRFAPLVEARSKRQTIRKDQQCRYRIGRRLQMFTGLRTRECRRLLDDDPVILVTAEVCLDKTGATVSGMCAMTTYDPQDFPRCGRYAGTDADEFARRDGFSDYAAMWGWFSSAYERETFFTGKFSGRLVIWGWPQTLV